MKTLYILIAIIGLVACTSKQDKGKEVVKPKTLLQELNESIEKNPMDPSLYITRAKNYRSHKDYTSAILDLQRVLELDSLNTDAYLELALLHFEQNKTKETNDFLNTLLAIDSMHIEANLKKAELELYIGDYQSTINLVNRVLKQEITNEKGYYMKAMAYKLGGDTVLAISNFQTTVEQDPDHYNAFIQLGLIFLAKNDPVCLNYFDNALAIQPASTEALYAVGLYFQNNNDSEKAKEVYEKILATKASHTDAIYNLGYLALNFDKEYEKARAYFQDGLRFVPKDSRFRYMEGLTYELEGNKEKAHEIYNSVLLNNSAYQLAIDGYERTK